ncbi:LRC8B protein, partial [Amia calva]|nr:LRC8B protein [Amia calva]
MLMIATLAGTLQVSQYKILCVPCQVASDRGCENPFSLDAVLANRTTAGSSASSRLFLPKEVNNLDLQQYAYIDAMCYEKHLHWFAKLFPYVVLLQTLALVVASNFWLQYPSSSSRLGHFVSILHKCCDSPWTTRTLSESVAEQRGGQSTLFKCSPVKPPSSAEDGNLAGIEPIGVFDRKEGEQAKAIFEKVKCLKVQVEENDDIYYLYRNQILAKGVILFIIFAYIPYATTCISFDVDCVVNIQALTGYQRYHCVHSLASIFKMLSLVYVIFLILYSFMCIYSLWWIRRHSLKQYSFASARHESSYNDIPDVKNDFAFILHLLDLYNPLFSKRFSVFLSEVSEKMLKQISLDHLWPLKKIKRKVVRNAQRKVELRLLLLSGIPSAVFDLRELEILKLELIPVSRFPRKVTQLGNLQELWLHYTATSLDSAALQFLSNNLKILRLKCTEVDKTPFWIFSLQNLRELHWYGNLQPEENLVFITGLTKLKNLQVLSLKNALPSIPQVITNSLPSLQKLSVDNEGTQLTVLQNLKTMLNLTCLELLNCALQRIPGSVSSLTNLQEIGLNGNNLRTIEEIISFQHLPRLCILKLEHNCITYIPMHIGALDSLEQLHLRDNHIASLPPQLFLCSKLHHLDLCCNNLSTIPDEIQHLKKLQYFAVTNNNIDELPDGLFLCKMLQSLFLGNNNLSVVPPQVGELVNLVQLDLTENQLESLPAELEGCLSLRASGLKVEERLFNSLPSSVKDRFRGSQKEQLNQCESDC